MENMQEALQAALAARAGSSGQASIAKLAVSFVKAWGEIPAIVQKDANNPHFGNDYATLEAVEKLVKPVLKANGLALLQAPGAVTNDAIEILGLLIHESGESISFKTVMPLGAKSTAQSAGSAITYGRRYQMLALFGIAPSDDDGEAASSAPAPAAPKKGKTETAPVDKSDVDKVTKLIESFSGTVEELETRVRPHVEALGDKTVNRAYVAKKNALRSKEN